MALLHAFLSYRIVSYVVMRHHRLGPDYWAAISYQLGFFLFFKFGGGYLVGTHDALWAEESKQIPSHEG